jgi:dCMP deaminase
MDHVLMTVAFAMARRATCNRNHVGSVIAVDGRIISSGYNGPPAGMPHCAHTVNSARSTRAEDGCRDAVHAEANAIAFAARHGVPTQGATLYTTLTPCLACAMLIINAGITCVVWCEAYRNAAGMRLLANAGLSTRRCQTGHLEV